MLRPDAVPVRLPVERSSAPATILPDVVAENPQFLHALLCQLGLPRSEVEGRVFERRSGKASLLVEAGHWNTGKEWVEQPVPYGTRPRLVLINICSEAVRTKSPVVNVGESVRAFLRRLGIDCGGQSMKNFKQQMIALSCCRLTLGYARADGQVGQIASNPVSRFQAWLSDEEGQKGLWPGELELSQPFFESLREHAVPLDGEAIGKLQHSSHALDVYSWLAHRLCRVESNAGQMVSWAALNEQFGKKSSEPNDFRKTFKAALSKAYSVYPDARVELVRNGLRLLPSPPPCKKERSVISLGAARPQIEDRKSTPANSTATPTKPREFRPELLVSSAALERARIYAHGWDLYHLEAKYKAWVTEEVREMPGNPDAAFVGWVKKYTKEQPPR